jgi:Holliday junction DNA helicase RuvA
VIAHLSGVLGDKDTRRPQRLVVDVQGVGYEVWAPLHTVYALGDTGARVSLRIHTHVREDALQLFGFATALEQILFERLIGVSGVGPKLALAVLSGLDPRDLVRAIRGSDIARLTGIPGVGRKTAERLIVELKDRIEADAPDLAPAVTPVDALRDDLISALGNLGYQRAASDKAVDVVLSREGALGAGFERALRDVLKELAR